MTTFQNFYQKLKSIRKTSGVIRVATFCVLFGPISNLQAQELPKHEKCIYRSPEGKLFINKDLPLFVKVSTSPDADSENFLLKSSKTAQYSNPMFLDTEGWNTLRSPSAVDSATRKTVYPLQDVIFDMYADGIAPKSKLNFGSSCKYENDEVTFLGGKVALRISGDDEMSGIQDFYYSVNSGSYQSNSNHPLEIEEEGKYEFKYYAVDNVGNAEELHEVNFVIDKSAPVTKHEIDGLKQNNILAPDAKISLVSNDSLSGVKKLFYAIDDKEFKLYRKPIPVALIQNGKGKIAYYAVDQVGNKEEPRFIGTLASANKEASEGDVFDYYIDRSAPEVTFEFDGDFYEGDREYISARTKVKLEATDDKSGVQKILYSYNSFITNETYDEPFNPDGNSPVELSYTAVDYVENTAEEKAHNFYIDRLAPKTNISFDGPVFRNRDTVFVSSKTSLRILGEDKESGLKEISYTLNGEKFSYDKPFSSEKNGANRLEWISVDNVNNKEALQKLVFVVDNEAPSVHYHFSVEPIGEKVVREEQYVIYPSNTKLYIGATDDVTGEESLKYTINGGTPSGKIPVGGFESGNYEIEIMVSDVLGNETAKRIRFAIEN
ncbi:OmpL47-type beta-barrel domain-containing protein [Marinilabilia rubra]|nr:hypothetical protein [Marinilabilia rubra]